MLDPTLLRMDRKWTLGRVIAVHPGRYNFVRAIEYLSCQYGTYVQPIVKLAFQPDNVVFREVS